MNRSAWKIAKHEATATQGMVTSNHPLATQAGLRILRQGGNAVDAAVATAFAIGVVEPFMSGVGGVACMLAHLPGQGTTVVVDGSTTVPFAAREDMYELLDPSQRSGMYGWRAVKGEENHQGYRSACVPGTVACLCESLERFGTLSRAQVMAPAIALAEEGFELDWYVAMVTAFSADLLKRFPESARVFFKPDGNPYRPPVMGSEGERFRQPDLARTLRLIADQGPDVLYRGEIARAIARDMAERGGLITEADLAAYRPRVLEPMRTTYRDHEIYGGTLPSGCTTVFEALHILEGFDLATAGQGSARTLHLIIEACRRAFADRFLHMGDPEMDDIPYEGLLSKQYAAARRATIDERRATLDVAAGDPWAYQARAGRAAVPSGAGAGSGDNTTHLTVVDHQRNVVTLTSTLGEIYGCGVTVPGTGIVLNDGMTWWNPEPGALNSIRPGKRNLWAISPCIAFRDGRPRVALGSPGGRKVMTAVLHSLLNVLDFGTGMQDAVNLPRTHCEGRQAWIDSRVPEATLDELRAMGHDLVVKEETFSSSWFARPNGILIDGATLRGGVNQFKVAWAEGY